MKIWNKILIFVLTGTLWLTLAGCGSGTSGMTSGEEALTLAESSTENTGWRITQHGENDGNQQTFYTIEDVQGGLIIIDGGYDYGADAVRKIIAEHDNHVEAWIISHPHPDHVGAFNAIMENPGTITVGNVYTVEIDGEVYGETAQDYDQYDVYEKFVLLTDGMDNVVYVRENDEWDVLGLHFKALHVWNDETEGLDGNLCNNGSMVFTVQGREDKMLFCSDLESDGQQPVIDRHEKELDVDYVQLGHHGNWGLSREFYEYTSPRAVFFDAPDWLVDMRENIYDAYMLKDYFLEKNVLVYSFGTAPNIIEIK